VIKHYGESKEGELQKLERIERMLQKKVKRESIHLGSDIGVICAVCMDAASHFAVMGFAGVITMFGVAWLVLSRFSEGGGVLD
jgi:hypothetical protein